MEYYKLNGKEFVTNGRGKIEVQTIKEATTKTPGRVAKIMVVRDVVKPSPGNMIWPNMMLALSFPEDKINAKKYKWHKNGPGEERQIPFQMKVPERPPETRKIIR